MSLSHLPIGYGRGLLVLREPGEPGEEGDPEPGDVLGAIMEEQYHMLGDWDDVYGGPMPGLLEPQLPEPLPHPFHDAPLEDVAAPFPEADAVDAEEEQELDVHDDDGGPPPPPPPPPAAGAVMAQAGVEAGVEVEQVDRCDGAMPPSLASDHPPFPTLLGADPLIPPLLRAALDGASTNPASMNPDQPLAAMCQMLPHDPPTEHATACITELGLLVLDHISHKTVDPSYPNGASMPEVGAGAIPRGCTQLTSLHLRAVEVAKSEARWFGTPSAEHRLYSHLMRNGIKAVDVRWAAPVSYNPGRFERTMSALLADGEVVASIAVLPIDVHAPVAFRGAPLFIKGDNSSNTLHLDFQTLLAQCGLWGERTAEKDGRKIFLVGGHGGQPLLAFVVSFVRDHWSSPIGRLQGALTPRGHTKFQQDVLKKRCK
eukprot:m.165462 g.165462  ORF g.165462 m.165462 type:complete len:428 (-) comp14673_c0_seq1:112-1395(-)